VEVVLLSYGRLIGDLVGSFLLHVIFFASPSHGRGRRLVLREWFLLQPLFQVHSKKP